LDQARQQPAEFVERRLLCVVDKMNRSGREILRRLREDSGIIPEIVTSLRDVVANRFSEADN
jgi:hypothetical protein